MFTVFRLIAGSGFGKWFGENFIKLIIIAVVGFFLWWVYSFVSNKFEQLDQLKVQVVQQAEVIDKITEEAKQKKESDAVTIEAIVQMQENILKLNEKFSASTVAVKKKIKEVDASTTLTAPQKQTAKSTIYIDDLNEAVCLANDEPCPVTP